MPRFRPKFPLIIYPPKLFERVQNFTFWCIDTTMHGKIESHPMVMQPHIEFYPKCHPEFTWLTDNIKLFQGNDWLTKSEKLQWKKNWTMGLSKISLKVLNMAKVLFLILAMWFIKIVVHFKFARLVPYPTDLTRRTVRLTSSNI